jgi:succinoglycan biosynthesis protein ExoV
MYLYCYRRAPNFGDALNFWLWERYFGKQLSEDPLDDEYFVGIGTLLNKRLPGDRILHIFGSGAGYGDTPPYNKDFWRVHFVRGPRTADALGLSREMAITDPAALLHHHVDLNRRKTHGVSFMPHHSIESARLREAVESAGVHYISPMLNCDFIIEEIIQSDKLICSAMHGAIVADALRVPWLPVITHSEIFEFKWHDWVESLELPLRFERLSPLYPRRGEGLIGTTRSMLKEKVFSHELSRLKKKLFFLSEEAVLKSKLGMIEDKIDSFKRQYMDW